VESLLRINMRRMADRCRFRRRRCGRCGDIVRIWRRVVGRKIVTTNVKAIDGDGFGIVSHLEI
jgi:hypothetical protein